MHIFPISYQIKPFNKANNHKDNNITIPYQIPFEARVDKRWLRFSDFHGSKERLTTTLKSYQGTLDENVKIKTPEVIKNAYDNLNIAKTIEDVQRLFADEKELFGDLTTLKKSPSNRGLIKIYKEFEEVFPDGILKSGDDFTVYLLRKLFVETKVYKDINDDLDMDLIPDIRDYFKAKYGHNKYVTTEIIQALGIYPFDKNMRNSIKFTKDGYSDKFGLTISESLLRRLKSMTEEEKAAEVKNRSQGLEEWWNDMSYEAKMELATSVNLQEEGYKSYRKYDNESRKRNRMFLESLKEFQKTEPEKKVKTGIKLNDKEVYILWMQNNIAQFYNSMSAIEKIAFEVERSRKQALLWQSKTPAEKTAFLNKIRIDIEPLRFAMIDAWNHSRILIRVLSEFLKEKQVERPVHMVYATEEFRDFQSKAMTEFWEKHNDMAKEFGTKLSYAHTKIKNAIKDGTFEDLKDKIIKEREERIKILAEEYEKEVKAVEKTEITTPVKKASVIDSKTKHDFVLEYRNRYKFLPASYTREMSEIIVNTFPRDIILKYTIALSRKEKLPEEVVKVMKEEGEKNNNPRVARLQRALEAAIATELTAKGGMPEFYGMRADSLIPLLENRLLNKNLPKQSRIDTSAIDERFNYYKKDLDIKELVYIANNFFVTKEASISTPEEEKILRDYLDEYGRTASILFPSTFSTTPLVHRNAFNKKFLTLMPQKLKDIVKPLIRTEEDMEKEYELSVIRGQIAKRFDFIPQEALDTYTRFVAATIRLFNEAKNVTQEEKEQFSIENIRKNLCKQAVDEDGQIITFNMPKYAMVNKGARLQLIAAEQAIAEELYRVANIDEEVFRYEIENLAVTFEMIKEIAKQSKKIGKKSLRLDDGNGIVIKTKPSSDNIRLNYLKIIKSINEEYDKIFNENDTINEEELLYILNPEEKHKSRDKYILERIKGYTIMENQKAEEIQQVNI